MRFASELQDVVAPKKAYVDAAIPADDDAGSGSVSRDRATSSLTAAPSAPTIDAARDAPGAGRGEEAVARNAPAAPSQQAGGDPPPRRPPGGPIRGQEPTGRSSAYASARAMPRTAGNPLALRDERWAPGFP